MVLEKETQATVSIATVNPNAVVYAIVEQATGSVINIVLWDGVEEWAPDDGFLAIQSDSAQIGWSYVDGKFNPPPVVPPTAEETLARNTAIRDSLLASATLAIAPLQDAVDLDDATAAETALLKKWKQFRVAVNRIDLTLESPSWPDQPA